jgi:hypothetical protein
MRLPALKKIGVGLTTLALPVLSFAQTATGTGTGTGSSSTVDFSSVTSAFSAGSIVTGVLAIAAVLMTVYVAMKGAKIIMSMVRGK